MKSAYGESIGTENLLELNRLVVRGRAVKRRLAGGRIEFQLVEPRPGCTPGPNEDDHALGSGQLDAAEMYAIAESHRCRRRGKKLSIPTIGRVEMVGNFVDFAKSKFEMWPFVGDTKAVRVGSVASAH